MPYHPPVGFHFAVSVSGLTDGLQEVRDGASPKPREISDDVRFTEVGGLSAELATEEYVEGGQNRYIQKYPSRVKYPELVLKRGLMPREGGIAEWVRSNIDDLQITPRTVFVDLLDEEHNPLVTWCLVGAYPTRWSVSDLNATANTFVVESLQLYYQYFTVYRR